MTDSGNPVAPPGWHSVTPRLVVRDASGFVEFLRHTFDAAGEFEPAAPSMVQIGDSKIMVSEAGERPPTPAFLYVYVRDAAALYRRAIELGATAVEPPFDTPYGDHRCMVADRWGNMWQIANLRKGHRAC